jgi:prepilin-type N-terminal cleavage/methylation domain-containing protein
MRRCRHPVSHGDFSRSATRCAGFSLVELLVVIAVIGILAAVAIAAMSGIFTRAEEAKAKRQAQNIVTTYAAAKAAGATFTILTKAGVVETLAATGVHGSGAFADALFIVPLNGTEKANTKISPYLVETTYPDGTFALTFSP